MSLIRARAFLHLDLPSETDFKLVAGLEDNQEALVVSVASVPVHGFDVVSGHRISADRHKCR